MKITIEGWEDKAVVIEGIKEFMLLAIEKSGQHTEAINAGAMPCAYFARRLTLRSDSEIINIYKKNQIPIEMKIEASHD
ncbi:MAG: hypothetical protein M0R80_13655 [Proteobacteria bacterium]|jgi:hypothetical protein|nr:hypothetical protein [Pseudomonadota bacterium]